MGRAPCCSKVGLNRGPWTPEEDMLLSKYIEAHGEGNWRALPKAAGLLRCGKSCRLRWVNYLRPNVKRGNISEDEEDLIIMLHALLGNRWSLIAARMPGRTDNEIKNYWNTHLSKKLASRGLDPKTHKPINSIKSSSANEKKGEDSRDGEDDHPQEAWETTMDLDTSSYSTGSCEDDGEHGRIQNKLSSRLISKRRHTLPPPVLKMTEVKKKQSTGSFSTESTEENNNENSEGNVEKAISQPNKFDCASPSSVLNVHSPAPSSSNSGSNCDSPGSSSQRTLNSPSEQSLSSFTSSAPQLPPAMEWEQQMQGQMALEFIDDFLCNNKEDDHDHHTVGDLFKEDGGVEFWDTLGKIEMPVPQTDLWDGLNDLIPSHGATPTSQHFPHIGNSDSTQAQTVHLPVISPSHSLPSTPFLQDNISELLFCP